MALPSSASPSKTHHAKPSPKSKQMKNKPSTTITNSSSAAVNSVAKRNNDPGVRLVGGRIYDSQNGKTCHQCRQKTMDFTAACKNQKNGKPCTIRFCHKCLLNRYGEKAEEKDLIDDWNCPKCRGKCNCSVCMKKKGQKPTGILVHAAKATGFSSVSEMLDVSCPDFAVKNVCVSPNKSLVTDKGKPTEKGNEGTLPRKNSKGNSSDGIIELKPQDLSLKAGLDSKKSRKRKQAVLDKRSDMNTKLKNQDLTPTAEPILKILKKKKHGQSNVSSEKNSDIQLHEVFNVESGKNTDLKSQDLSSAADRNPKKPRKRKHGLSKGSSGQNTENAGGLDRNSQSSVSIQFEESNNLGNASKLEDDGSKAKGCMKKVHKSSKTCVKGLMESKCLEQKPTATVDPTEKNVADREVFLAGNADVKVKPKMQAETQPNNINCATATISPPVASDLTDVAGIELPSGDVGHALQFLEFCAAFGKILNMRKGQAELIIRELVGTRERRRAQYSAAVHFHIELINMIQKDSGEACTALRSTTGHNLWFQALRKCISNSKFHHILTNAFAQDFLSDSGGYDALDSSKKLMLLNFLCDEALNTEKMRSWIEEEYSKFLEREKACREQVAAAKEKERDVKKKMQDELAKAIIAKSGAPFTVSEHEAVISQIKLEAAEAHAQMLEAKGTLPNKLQRISAARTEPIFVDSNGNKFWRLKGRRGDHNLLLQDIKEADGNVPCDQWLAYDANQKSDLEIYISARKKEKLRARSVVRHRPLCKPAGIKI